MKSLVASAAVWAALAVAFAQSLHTELTGEYSQEGRIAGIEGRVRIECTINGRGKAHDLRVIQSLGLGLDEMAMEAVAQHQFPPLSSPFGLLPNTISVNFVSPSKQSRWHLWRAEFHPLEGASRPTFLTAKYPLGAGISAPVRDQGRVVVAMGRQATVRLSFEVDKRGVPVHFSIQQASDDIWGSEAISMVSQWQFKPGMKDGSPVVVPATAYLSWGSRKMSESDLKEVRSALRFEPSAVTAASHSVLETYSEEAHKLGVGGDVAIALPVGTDGVPNHVRVVSSLGESSDELALKMISAMKFQPSLLNGQRTEIPIGVEVSFYTSGRVKISWH